jgi:hypothetical protein
LDPLFRTITLSFLLSSPVVQEKDEKKDEEEEETPLEQKEVSVCSQLLYYC